MSGSIACAGANGESLTIKGVNWFGFETSSTMMDGLWQGPNAITQNFQAVVWRIKLMGFNTVRIPLLFPGQLQVIASVIAVTAVGSTSAAGSGDLQLLCSQ